MAGFNTETVVVVRPPAIDKFGDPVPGSSSETPVGGCLFAPGPSEEGGLGTNQVVTDGHIYGPAGMDIEASDRVRIRGLMYVVVGRPQRWGTAGVVTAVRLYEG